MNLLFISDMAHTGFGRVGRELATRLLVMGHQLRIIAINWRGIDGELSAIMGKVARTAPYRDTIAAAQRALDELRVDPLPEWMVPANVRGNAMGHDLTAPAVLAKLWRGWRPEAVLVIADPLAMLERLLTDGGTLGKLPVCNYVPIEGGGLPPQYRLIWEHSQPVAMSSFGQRELETLLERPVPLIPHGVSEGFYPVSFDRPGRWQRERPVTSKDDAKAALGWQGRTVILRVDRHIRRKNYADWFRTLRPVLAAHPEVLAVAHCAPVDEEGSLYDLISREPGAIRTEATLNAWTHPQIVLTNATDTWRGLDDDSLNVLYNAADLMLTTTMAEGFGLTQAEALSCGVPVIATDYSAIPEVVGPGGVLIPPRDLITNQYAHEWALPDVAAMSAALERLVSRPAERREIGAAGRRHVARFSWAAAAEQFEQVLKEAIPVAV